MSFTTTQLRAMVVELPASSLMNGAIAGCGAGVLLNRLPRKAMLLGALLAWSTLVSAQAAPAHRRLSKHYCHPRAGFCFRYPSTWSPLGDIFNGNGIVVAPQQAGDRAQWDTITVALVAAPGDSGQAPGLNNIVDQTTKAMHDSGQSFQTLQRRELTVDHNPAQMLKAQYRAKASGRDWIEELVFIQDADDDLYSVALKCAPDHLVRLEPALKEVLGSWSIQETQSPPEPPAGAAPASPPPTPSSPPQEKP